MHACKIGEEWSMRLKVASGVEMPVQRASLPSPYIIATEREMTSLRLPILPSREKMRREPRKAIPPREGLFRDYPPISRRGKPISEIFRRLPAAGSRFPKNFPHFPPREKVSRSFISISRRGKRLPEVLYPFPAAGRRFGASTIGLVRRKAISRKYLGRYFCHQIMTIR